MFMPRLHHKPYTQLIVQASKPPQTLWLETTVYCYLRSPGLPGSAGASQDPPLGIRGSDAGVGGRRPSGSSGLELGL